jgi:hypothetical protein
VCGSVRADHALWVWGFESLRLRSQIRKRAVDRDPA